MDNTRLLNAARDNKLIARRSRSVRKNKHEEKTKAAHQYEKTIYEKKRRRNVLVKKN